MEPFARLVAPAEKSLLVAVIDSAPMPLLLLDGDQLVVAASETFCSEFGVDPHRATGMRFAALGNGEWASSQLDALLVATASGFAGVAGYELCLDPSGQNERWLVLSVHRLDYEHADEVRVLLSINDITSARASDRAREILIAEKGVMLQELQHRVANSLQIVASVLLQSARRVQSDEVRGHLTDAHTRVMSIAALQRHLTASHVGDVALGPYLKALCRTIEASMIHDPDRISLEVQVDGSVTAGETSISIGLIVTELVINALKHAFPDPERCGRIVVGYHSNGPAWALSICDDGVGMSADATDGTGGLGTSIVAALSHQLDASVHKEGLDPGTIVWIIGNRPSGTA